MAHPTRLTGVAGTLVLVRHGETTWIAEGRFQGRSDPPLSSRGERQAQRVAARLAAPGSVPVLPLPTTPPIGVWHSPLARAASVAAAISAAHGVAPTPSETLLELDHGAWEGLTHREVEQRYGPELAAWRRDPTRHHAPGGESLEQAAERAAAGAAILIDALRRETQAGTAGPPWLVAVAHDGLLRLLLFHLLRLPPNAFWSFPFGLCAVTIVEVDGGVARLRAYNLVDHLDGLDTPDQVGAPEP